MKTFINIITIVILFLLLILIGWWYLDTHNTEDTSVSDSTASSTRQLVSTENYICNDSKAIEAKFYTEEVTVKPEPGERPVPTGSAEVSLSDGRTLDLKQTISADGIRYSDGDPDITNDEHFVFWSKGNGALVLENNEDKTYVGCITAAPETNGLTKIYHDGTSGFTIRYPQSWTVDDSYTYEARGPEEPAINGVKFHIPAALAEGTNLSESDTGITVETISGLTSCSAEPFLAQDVATSTIAVNGVDYSYGTTTDAGAGNLYQEQVFARLGTNPCLAIRYFVHSSRIENYEPGTVKEYDAASLTATFDAIRDSLVLAQ